MKRYIATRFLQGLIVIALVSIVTFGMMHLVPGDPVDLLVGEAKITLEEKQAIRAKWGLDQPVHKQYLTWVRNMASGQLGVSMIRPGVPVLAMITEAAAVTIKLNLIAISVAVCVAIPAGILAAVKRYSFLDYVIGLMASLGVALPNYWIGLMLIVLFAFKFQILPPFGIMSWKGYILPVVVLAFEEMALLTRMMRSASLEVLGQDYVRTARAKGVAEVGVMLRHVARNALLPVITVIGYRFAFILSGTIVVETVFALPGLGRLFINSVNNLDYQVVQAIVFILSIVVVLSNLITDLLYSLVDPRIRVG
jgi:ABC-type dipeptide/oligopeptide/nickel transport system permease component